MRLQDYRGLCAILVTLQYFGVLRLCRSHCRDYSVHGHLPLGWAPGQRRKGHCRAALPFVRSLPLVPAVNMQAVSRADS